jgi:hypothetical protein
VHSYFCTDYSEKCELSCEQRCLKIKPEPTSPKQCLLLFVVIVSGLTAEADIVRALEKMIHSS